MSSDLRRSREKNADLAERIRQRTPARLLVGRAGEAYTTITQLQLRADHAAARDAVWCELDLGNDLGQDLIQRWNLFEASTRAQSKSEYLLRPDLGRELTEESVEEIKRRCTLKPDIQIVVGDGLSTSAVAAQAPRLLPLLVAEAERRGWSVGQTFAVRHCRVGIMNIVGELLRPRVVVLLIGERPGMSTAESLSAYMGYEPRRGHTDAERNLISNIQDRGVSVEEAARRICNLAAEFLRLQVSGVAVKEPSVARVFEP